MALENLVNRLKHKEHESQSAKPQLLRQSQGLHPDDLESLLRQDAVPSPPPEAQPPRAPPRPSGGLGSPARNGAATTFFDRAFELVYYSTLAAGATVLGIAWAGPAAPLIGGALGLGIFGGGVYKGIPLYDNLTNSLRAYAVVNVILQPIILLGEATYPIVGAWGANLAASHGIGAGVGSVAAKSVYALTGYNAAFTASYRAGDHVAKNRGSLDGLGKYVTENFWAEDARIGKVFAPGYLLTANGLTTLPISIFGAPLPTFAANALPVGFYNTVHPVGEKKPEPGGMSMPMPDNV